MEIKEPAYRFGGNWKELAQLFNYEIGKDDQDWTYTIAEPERIDEYIKAYDSVVINEDTKFSLMEMIIQALEDIDDLERIQEKWYSVESLLLKDFSLHEFTIYYWCCWESEEEENHWLVTPMFRRLWLDK